MNHRLTADEVAYILDDSDAVAVFAGDAFVPMADAVRGRSPKVRAWILLGAERRAWAVPFDDLVATGRTDPVELPGGEGSGRPRSTPPAPPASPRARGGAGRIPAGSSRRSPRST